MLNTSVQSIQVLWLPVLVSVVRPFVCHKLYSTEVCPSWPVYPDVFDNLPPRLVS